MGFRRLLCRLMIPALLMCPPLVLGFDGNIYAAVQDAESGFDLKSKSAVLIEVSTGKVLYQYNPHEKLRPASVTKIMPLLLLMEALDSGKISQDAKVPCSENAWKMGGSQIWLEPGEEMTVHDLLKAMAIVSANDATVAIAEFLAGTEQRFVGMMNKRAKELGMNDTNFVNCHGLDADEHYTSAYDIALMSRELVCNHPKIHEYLSIWMDSLRDGGSQLVNTNKLIRFYKGANGIKTGSTSLALYSLSASAQRDDLKLIAVVMAAPTSQVRFDEASNLLNYGFANFHSLSLERKNDFMGEVLVSKGTRSRIFAVTSEDVNLLVNKGEEKEITRFIDLKPQMDAPIQKGEVIGALIYRIKEREIGRTNLIASAAVERISTLHLFGGLVRAWFRVGR